MTSQIYSSHQQTRQQLDELDALLQRMLTLPLHSSEPAKPVPEPQPAANFAPLPPTLPQMHLAPRPENSPPVIQAWRLSAITPTEEPPMAIPVDIADQSPPTQTPAPYPYSLVFGQQLPAEAPPPLAETVADRASTGAAIGTPPVWAIPVGPEERSAPSLFALPFVAINGLFDLFCYMLGPLGSALRHPTSKNLLGWMGIMMLLGAIGWAAREWYQADWPR